MIDSSTPNPNRRTLGIYRDKMAVLKNKRLEMAKKKNRFKKGESDKEKLLNSSASHVIEIGAGSSVLGPIWLDYHDDIREKLKKIPELASQLQKLRVTVDFKDNTKLSSQANKISGEAMKILKECEENHRKISELGRTSAESENDKKVRMNIERAIAMSIQDATLHFRKFQKDIFDKIQDNCDVENNESTIETENNNKEMEQLEDIARGRDQDINRLIDTINELAHMFKQMNQLVIEQGTIVDRIDFNLEQAEVHTNKGKGQLRKALSYQESKCGDYCIKILIFLNIIFAFLFLMKYKSKN